MTLLNPPGKTGGVSRFLLKLLVHGQRDLRRDVNEPLAQQEAHRLGGVIQKLVQLFDHALLTVLLTGA